MEFKDELDQYEHELILMAVSNSFSCSFIWPLFMPTKIRPLLKEL